MQPLFGSETDGIQERKLVKLLSLLLAELKFTGHFAQ